MTKQEYKNDRLDPTRYNVIESGNMVGTEHPFEVSVFHKKGKTEEGFHCNPGFVKVVIHYPASELIYYGSGSNYKRDYSLYRYDPFECDFKLSRCGDKNINEAIENAIYYYEYNMELNDIASSKKYLYNNFISIAREIYYIEYCKKSDIYYYNIVVNNMNIYDIKLFIKTMLLANHVECFYDYNPTVTGGCWCFYFCDEVYLFYFNNKNSALFKLFTMWANKFVKNNNIKQYNYRIKNTSYNEENY